MNMRRAFTLTEILVAMAIFVSLMLIGSMAVANFQRIGNQARQSLAIASRAEALGRFLERQLGQTVPFAGMYHGPIDGRESLVFLRFHQHNPARFSQLAEVDLALYGYGQTRATKYTQIQWAIISWTEDGQLINGVSVAPPHGNDYANNNYAGTLNTKGNHAIPTVQRQIAHLIGTDDSAAPGNASKRGGFMTKRVRKTTGEYDDVDGNGMTEDEYAENGWLGTMLNEGFFGDNDAAVGGGYAVANADGRSYNKDWMYLVGSDDDPDYWRDQRRLLLRDVEFISVDFLQADGSALTTESDSMGDASASQDWNGLPFSGLATDTLQDARPRSIVFTYLLHAVPNSILDDSDEDNDGDIDERLIDAVRDAVLADGLDPAASRLAMAERLDGYGYLAQTFRYAVDLP